MAEELLSIIPMSNIEESQKRTRELRTQLRANKREKERLLAETDVWQEAEERRKGVWEKQEKKIETDKTRELASWERKQKEIAAKKEKGGKEIKEKKKRQGEGKIKSLLDKKLFLQKKLQAGQRELAENEKEEKELLIAGNRQQQEFFQSENHFTGAWRQLERGEKDNTLLEEGRRLEQSLIRLVSDLRQKEGEERQLMGQKARETNPQERSGLEGEMGRIRREKELLGRNVQERKREKAALEGKKRKAGDSFRREKEKTKREFEEERTQSQKKLAEIKIKIETAKRKQREKEREIKGIEREQRSLDQLLSREENQRRNQEKEERQWANEKRKLEAEERNCFQRMGEIEKRAGEGLKRGENNDRREREALGRKLVQQKGKISQLDRERKGLEMRMEKLLGSFWQDIHRDLKNG